VLWARPESAAAWLRLPDAVMGLAPAGAPLGPRWVQRPEPWPALVEGQAIAVDADGLHTDDGSLIVDHRHAVGWLGPLPDPGDLSSAAARARITGALSTGQASSLLESPWHEAVSPAVSSLGRLPPLDALTIAAGAIGGLGPGLTPAGDDMLSGMLFAVRALGGPAVEPALQAVARSVRTTDVAAAMLQAAAGGFHIEPVHDLVMAAAAGDTGTAAGAANELDRFGSSSGADIAYGLRVAFTRH